MIKLTFLGDIMCEQESCTACCTEGIFNFSPLFEKVKPFLSESDLVFGNLETPISKNSNDLVSEKYCFNAPLEFAKAIKEAGIDFVATANNHCLDRGIAGVASTTESLDMLGLRHTGIGIGNVPFCIMEYQGLRLGILSYTYGTNAFHNHYYLRHGDRNSVNLFQNQELSNPLTRYCLKNNRKSIARIYNKLVRIFTPEQWTCPVYERREFHFYRMRRLKRDLRQLKKAKPDLILFYMHIGGQYNPAPLSYTKEVISKVF